MECIEELNLLYRIYLYYLGPILDVYGDVRWFNYPNIHNNGSKARRKYKHKVKTEMVSRFVDENEDLFVEILSTFSSEYNNLLFDTLDKAVLLSSDMDLLNIINNLKNRRINLTKASLIKAVKNHRLDSGSKYYLVFNILAYTSYYYELLNYLKIRKRLDKDGDELLSNMGAPF